NYTLLFMTALSFVNLKKFRLPQLAVANLILNLLCILLFLLSGLYTLSELRESYLLQAQAPYYHRGIFNVWIRYISLAFAGGLFLAIYRYVKSGLIKAPLQMSF